MEGMREADIPENRVARVVVDAAMQIHRHFGPGLLESVYEAVLGHELVQRGLRIQRQVGIPLRYQHMRFDVGFRADLIVEDLVLVELKSVERLTLAHRKQVLTYLRITGHRLGLLLNFGEAHLKNGIARIANDLREQQSPP